jgi:RPA family protein
MVNMRSTAFKLKIEDLVRGQYVRSPEGTEPSHLLTPWGQHTTRARVLGTIVDKFVRDDQGYAILRLDDGSETISLRAWREGVPELASFEVGDLIDVMGRVREFEGEVYLVPELILRVEDPNWELVRELEILRARKRALAQGIRPQPKREAKLEPRQLQIELPPTTPGAEPTVETIEEVQAPPLPEVPDETKRRVVLAIEKLDKGEGAAPTDIAAELDLRQAETEDALRVLLVDGDIFEPRAGRFRRLK